MANLNETDQWVEGVYQLEEDDPVLGGPTGIDNRAPRELASRSRYQRLRNVTPWDATFAYPANVAYVSYGGTTWKSVGESLNIAPGTDVAKWMRWGFTAAELNDSLGNAVAAHEAKVNPHPQYVTDAALEAHAAYPAAHVNYVRHDAAQGLTNSQATQARTNIGAEATGVAATEVQKGSARYSADTGAANAAVVSYAPAITVLTDGMVLLFAAAATNTGATTLNVNGLGAKPVLGEAQAPLQGGEIVANGKCTVVWHATLNSFVLIGCTGAAQQVGPATKPGHAIQLGQATGRLLRTLVYVRLAGVQNVIVDGAAPTTAGAGTYTPSAGLSFIDVEVQGAGSGGAGATGAGAGNVSLGAPGCSGSYARARWTAASVGASQTITVGAGSAGSSGVVGGTSSIGSLTTAPGGTGAAAVINLAPPSNNGNGVAAGAPTGANLYAVTGRSPFVSVAFSAGVGYGGAGGTSQFGQGAAGPAFNTGGVSATNPGSGGSGVVINQAGGTAQGGAGADGIIIIREYA
jgi:hypothetical protein